MSEAPSLPATSLPRRNILQNLFFLSLPVVAIFFSACGRGSLGTDEQIRGAYETGLEYIAMYDLNRAYPYLQSAYNSISEDHPLSSEITLAYAVTLLHFTPVRPQFIAEAEALLGRVAETADGTEVGQLAMIELGRSLEIVDFQGDIPDMESARTLYRRAYNTAPASNVGVSALIYLSKSLLKEYDNPAAIRAGMEKLSGHLEQYPGTEMETILWQMLGDAHIFNFEETREALDAYQRVDELGFIDRPRTDRYKWRMAGWAEDIEDYDEAVRILTSIVVDTPRSPLGTQARNWIIELRDRFPERGYEVPDLFRFGTLAIDL